MKFQTLARVNSGKSAEELQSHALFTPFLFALSKMSLRTLFRLQSCSVRSAFPVLFCPVGCSVPAARTQNREIGEKLWHCRGRGEVEERSVWKYKKDETQMSERGKDRPIAGGGGAYFLGGENVFFFMQEPECESVNQPAGPWSLSSMSEPVTAAAAETATSLQQLPTNVWSVIKYARVTTSCCPCICEDLEH